MPARHDYRASCLRLGDYLAPGEVPPVPGRMPRYDDEEPLGVTFFRLEMSGDDLGDLTLPRTFFGRSALHGVSFRHTDLTESNLCWNDFVEVDFSHATLTDGDLRASLFARVSFRSADLRGADLRRSSFEHCDFTGACMAGAMFTPAQGDRLALSSEQRRQIRWTDDEGPEPDGG